MDLEDLVNPLYTPKKPYETKATDYTSNSKYSVTYINVEMSTKQHSFLAGFHILQLSPEHHLIAHGHGPF
jgi:hypothetical protein